MYNTLRTTVVRPSEGGQPGYPVQLHLEKKESEMYLSIVSGAYELGLGTRVKRIIQHVALNIHGHRLIEL